MARPDFLPEGFGTVARAGFEEVWVPAPVPMTPQTAGWWIVGILLIGASAYWVYRRYRRYRVNAYRRAALDAVSRLQQAVRSDKANASALPVLLKRAALGGFSRRRVAALSGESWGAFLMETAPGAFDERTARHLVDLSCRGVDALTAADITALLAAAQRWIRRHRAAV